MGFWGGCSASSVQRLVTVNNTVLSRYTALAPGVSQRLAIGNSDTYGGAGGTYATATGGNALSALISPARDRPLARQPPGRVRLLPARRAGRVLHGRRAVLGPPHAADDRPDAHPAEEVVALDRRAERGRRPDRPLRGRHVLRQVHLAPEPALDHEVARLLLRPGQPRGHDPAHLGAGQARRRLDADDRAGRQQGHALGRHAAPGRPRARRHVDGRRHGRPEQREPARR